MAWIARIVPARQTAVALMLVAETACRQSVSAPILVERRVQFAEAPPVMVRVTVQPEHAANADRYATAAEAIVKASVETFGPFPQSTITVVDPPWRQPRGSRAPEGVVVLEHTPWWELPPAMKLELNVTRGIARRFLIDAIGSPALPGWFVDGFAEFIARRATVRLFETRALPGGFAALEVRFFGGFVPRELPIRLYPESDGEPLLSYRRNPRVDPSAGGSTDDRQSLVAKTVLTLATLEQWLGRPAFEAAVSQFVSEYRGKAPSLDAFTRTISAVSGQDLSWLTDQAFRTPAVIDYGVEGVYTAPDGSGSYRTTVVVARAADGTFPGTSASPVGPFESGRGVAIRTTFLDGSVRDETWDGRSAAKTFEYRSPSAAVSAEIDPHRMIVLDVRRANNGRMVANRSASRAATIWSARWVLWLEGFLLTYASLF